MEGLITFFVFCGGVILFINLINNKSKQKREAYEDEWVSKTPILKSSVNDYGVDAKMYRKRYSLMNSSESSFFHVALKHLPEGYFIFPKMRIADIIETVDGHGYYQHRNKILPKHVDFIICDKNLRPVCAIEIDGSSHNHPAIQERDLLVNYIFKSVGIPLQRVRVGESFERVCSEMNKYWEVLK